MSYCGFEDELPARAIANKTSKIQGVDVPTDKVARKAPRKSKVQDVNVPKHKVARKTPRKSKISDEIDLGLFRMPTADETLARRQIEDAEIEQIREVERMINECSQPSPQKEPPKLDTNTDQCIKGIDINLNYISDTFKEPHLGFLTRYFGYVKKNENIDFILSQMLESLDLVVQEPSEWDSTSLCATCIILAHLSTCKLNHQAIRHISHSKTLLHIILTEKCSTSQITMLGKFFITAIPLTEHRLELVSVLDSGVGDHMRLLAKGIVKQSLKEMLTAQVNCEKWETSPYKIDEITPLVQRIWPTLLLKNQYILAQLLSKNFTYLDILLKNDLRNTETLKMLFRVMRSNITSYNKSDNNVRIGLLQLKWLINQMEVLQTNLTPHLGWDHT